MRPFLVETIDSLSVAFQERGGEVPESKIGRPATEAEVELVEREIGARLPHGLRDFFLQTATSLSFEWSFDPSGPSVPEGVTAPHWGYAEISLEALRGHEESRAAWIENCFPDAENEYDRVWHNKLAFHFVGNGDLIALDSDGRVVYLSHDDGEGHGLVLGVTFSEFLRHWLSLGCPGPEDWEWLTFYDPTLGRLDSESDEARSWINWVETGQ